MFNVAGWTELAAMNALQEHGVISDNCVDWADVGNKAQAIAWLKANQGYHVQGT